MEQVIISVVAGVGAVVAGLFGWLESGEAFDARKFWPTIFRGAVAAGIVAMTYPFIETMGFWPGIFGAFFSGAGFDVLGHRIAGTVYVIKEE